MITPKVSEGRVVFGPCRLSYAHLFEKHSIDPAQEGKYMTNVLIPKSETETIKALERAIEHAKTAGVASKWEGTLPKKLELPLRDGDEREDEEYAAHLFVNAKSSTRPGLVDRNRVPIVDEEELYSGVWAIVSVTFYPYNAAGKKGVACGLNNVMKFKDGERMGGRMSADADFADVRLDDDEDDDL